MKLEIRHLQHDLGIDLGYYEVGGRLTDPSNTLTSEYGEYVPTTKEANFYTRVHLNSLNNTDTLDIYTDHPPTTTPPHTWPGSSRSARLSTPAEPSSPDRAPTRPTATAPCSSTAR